MNESSAGLHMRDSKWKGPIAWMAQHPVAANLLMIVLIGAGLWTAFRIQKEVFPQFQLDIVEVSVSYPGAAPEEVEQGILLPVEEAIRGVRGIKEIVSTAREGSGSVQIELVAGTDRMRAFQDIDQAVTRIRTFPDDIEEPEVRLQARQRDVMEIGIYGQVDVWTLRQLAERLRNELLNHPSITQVDIGNVPDYVTHIEIPHHRLREYNLTLGDVAQIVEQSSRDIPAGSIDTHGGEILLRLKERKQWAERYATIPVVTTPGGSHVLLGDIAEIRDGFEEIGFHSQFNQQPSVELSVYRVGNESPLEIAAAVDTVLLEFSRAVPEGVNVRIDSNRAKDYKDRLYLLIENGAQAVGIVLLILALFLEYRLAFWVMMGMAISFIGGMAFLPIIGVSVNMISMFAFLVVIGIVVDDAIVVGENMYEYRQRGLGRAEAAIEGTRDIAAPVVFSILTTIVAFVPILFIPGTTGKFWRPLPAVVITILVVSLVEALFILPAHLAHSRQKNGNAVSRKLRQGQQAFARLFERFVNSLYWPFLKLCIRYRYITLSIALTLLLVVGSYAYSDHMGMIMMPEVAADEIEAGVRLPVGTTIAQAGRVAMQITRSTHEMFEEHNLYEAAEGIKTNVRGQNFIDVEIVMKPPEERDITANEVIELWRDEIGDIEGVDQITFEAERGPGGYRDDISVDVSHSNIEVLEKASQKLLETVERFEATRDVTDNYERGKIQYDFTLLPEGQSLGLTPSQVGRQVRNAFYGAIARRQLRGTNEIEVRVKLPKREREELHNLENFVVRTADGTEIPLLQVAQVEIGEAFTSIHRRDGRRVVTVGMDVEPPRETTRVLKVMQNEILPQLRADHPGLTWSFEGSQAEMRESTKSLWGGFVLASLVIYALLAIAFGNYVQPLVVMTAIPFGIVGAVLGHMLLGYDLSLISVMGVIALSGVVVNDSLIMIDYANKRRREHSAFDAIHQAGVRRFRPIFLTTFTTFGGLTPIILERSQQANYLIPMAISLGFGIVFVTAIILMIVPCLYMIHEDIASLLSKDRKTPA
jgi:multidrug efflux pump subunit AcrB